MVKHVLVIDAVNSCDWKEIFKGKKIGSEEIEVHVAAWDKIQVTTYDDTCLVNMSLNGSIISFTPNIVLVRAILKTLAKDHRNTFYALHLAGIPFVNNAEALYFAQERIMLNAALRRIRDRLGSEKFPFIEHYYYPSPRNMVITPQFPVVCKIGTACGGFGKMKIDNLDHLQELGSVLALYKDYITIEPFIKHRYDLRVQMIGRHFRAIRKESPNWKSNYGAGRLEEEIPVTKRMKQWCEECSKMFGGIDILAIDAVMDDNDKCQILECNIVAPGFYPNHIQEDSKHVRDIVLKKLEKEGK